MVAAPSRQNLFWLKLFFFCEIFKGKIFSSDFQTFKFYNISHCLDKDCFSNLNYLTVSDQSPIFPIKNFLTVVFEPFSVMTSVRELVYSSFWSFHPEKIQKKWRVTFHYDLKKYSWNILTSSIMSPSNPSDTSKTLKLSS